MSFGTALELRSGGSKRDSVKSTVFGGLRRRCRGLKDLKKLESAWKTMPLEPPYSLKRAFKGAV